MDISNVFKCVTSKNQEKLLINEIKNQYDSIVSLHQPHQNKSDTNSDIGWMINCYQTAFFNHIDNKLTRKRYLSLLYRSLILSIDDIRLKYPPTTTTKSIDDYNSNNKNDIGLNNKILEYKLQIITRLEYMNLYIEIRKENIDNSSNNDDKNDFDEFENNISVIVILLQEISFILDSIVVGGLISFLENVIIPQFIKNLKKVLSKIYKTLEISKPEILKNHPIKSKEEKLQELLKNSNIATLNDTKETTNLSVKQVLKVEIDNDHQKSKKLKLDQQQKYLPQPQHQQQPKDNLESLLKKVPVKKLNHFSMSLSNPKHFKTYTNNDK